MRVVRSRNHAKSTQQYEVNRQHNTTYENKIKIKRVLLSSTQKDQSLDLGEIDGNGLANLLKDSWGKKYFKLEIEAENWGVLYCRN